MRKEGWGSVVAADGFEVEAFDFLTRPRSLSKKGQARFNTGILQKAIDLDLTPERPPSIFFQQKLQDELERLPVQRVIRMCIFSWFTRVVYLHAQIVSQSPPEGLFMREKPIHLSPQRVLHFSNTEYREEKLVVAEPFHGQDSSFRPNHSI